jgi:TonB family protein
VKRIVSTLVAVAALVPGAGLAQAVRAGPATEQARASETSLTTTAGQSELDVNRMLFDAESIRQVVRHHMPEVQRCYERVLADTGQKLEGRVMIRFVIDPNGNVSEAKLVPKKSTLKDERVVDCVLAMRRWPFPRPGDDRDHPIEYPFDLKVVNR